MLVHSLTLFPWFFVLNLLSVCLLVAGCIIFYIAIFMPEGLVISQVQFIRASELFVKIKNSSNNEINENLREYIDSIPDSSGIADSVVRVYSLNETSPGLNLFTLVSSNMAFLMDLFNHLILGVQTLVRVQPVPLDAG